jgi:hypothetical protein
MRNLIEKLLADGSEYLYIVQRPGETAVGVESGPALLQACYNTEDIGRAMHYAALDVSGGVRWYEPEDAEKWAAEALIVAGSSIDVEDVLDIANGARIRVGTSRVSTEAVLTAYMKAKHGANHE